MDSGRNPAGQSQPSAQGLITSGEFGPVIGTVLVDAAQGKLTWSHWEKGARGPKAIFHYMVPRNESHYEVKFCCVSGESIDGVVARKTGYHGEMAVDPASGAIMRLTLRADLSPADKIVRADILVEYGPVDIGGQTYICPVKSISISVAPAPPAQMLDLRHNAFAEEALKGDRSPGLQTKLNDVVFDQYHVFRTEARVLTGDAPPSTARPAGDRASIASESSSQDVTQPMDGAPPTAAPAPDGTGASSAAVSPSPEVVPAPPQAKTLAATPEIAAEGAAKVPEITEATPTAEDKNFTLRVTTRLVDVGVVAFDKKGHPVADLRPEDFEIFDNGRRQTVRSFSGPRIPSGEQAGASTTQPSNASAETVYSNRRASADDAGANHAKN